VPRFFARYLEPQRNQAGIPGLSAAITPNGRIIWEGSGAASHAGSRPAIG